MHTQSNLRDSSKAIYLLTLSYLIHGETRVSFQDLQKPDYTKKLGYGKIERGCHQALSKVLEYIWIDTCCIDKTSSSELQEAINSMFRWYKNAKVCYVYLFDVPPGEDHGTMSSSFRRTRWFTRGWTLKNWLLHDNLSFTIIHGNSFVTETSVRMLFRMWLGYLDDS
jgi:hypothetical protein